MSTATLAPAAPIVTPAAPVSAFDAAAEAAIARVLDRVRGSRTGERVVAGRPTVGRRPLH